MLSWKDSFLLSKKLVPTYFHGGVSALSPNPKALFPVCRVWFPLTEQCLETESGDYVFSCPLISQSLCYGFNWWDIYDHVPTNTCPLLGSHSWVSRALFCLLCYSESKTSFGIILSDLRSWVHIYKTYSRDVKTLHMWSSFIPFSCHCQTWRGFFLCQTVLA